MTTTPGKPFAPIRGKRMRLTRLTAAAAADTTGTAAMGISSGFVSAKLTPQWDDGQTIQVKTADGDLCVNEPAQSTLSYFTAELAFCGVDPDLFALMTGYASVVDAHAAATGLRLSGGVPVTNGYALEVWSGVAKSQTAWGYFLLPYLFGGKINDFTIENNSANFSITSNTREGSGWGTGPYNVVDTASTGGPTPGKLLQAIGSRDHLHFERTTIAPPDAISGLATVAA